MFILVMITLHLVVRCVIRKLGGSILEMVYSETLNKEYIESHSTSPHDTVYNHASWRLFENHFYYLTRDVSTPGVGILGT